MRSWRAWLLILMLVVVSWFGWRYTQSLRSQIARQHEHFVEEFQNGIRGAYSEASKAQRSLTNGSTAAAKENLQFVNYYLTMMWTGANGMSVRLDAALVPVTVVDCYQMEVTNLRSELITGSSNSEIQQGLDNLVHDLKLLSELFGDYEHKQWLKTATADDFSAKFQIWREKAVIKCRREAQ